ncbi:MAG: type IV pilus secretin PilQ, partial [Nitrospinales bacterium]
DIIRIATQKKLAQEARERLAAEKAKAAEDIAEEESEELITEVRRINYADIEELTKSLQSLRDAWAVGKSDRGRITTDQRTNTVILTDVRAHINEMIELINTLDIQMPQVMIESRIVEVTRNVAKDLGIQWGGSVSTTTDKEFPNTIEGGAGNLTSDGFIVDLPAAAVVPTSGASLGLALGSLTKDVILDIQLSALETQGKGRILSTPKVTTSDNKEAKIMSGRKIPYATVSSDGTQIEFVDAVLSLTVTPHITADNFIQMKIKAKKDAADFSNQVLGTPTITIKEADTEVFVKDGDTAVLGGLYESEVSKTRSQVPWFGDIPFLGNLFKNSADSEDIDELLIFITPTIIKDTRVPGL